MTLPIEAVDRIIEDKKITEVFLQQYNLQVIKQFENAPTLAWAVEFLDYLPSPLKAPKPPIVLTRMAGKENDTVSIQVNRRFMDFTTRQQILAVYYLGQLSLEQGPLDSVTLDAKLGLQTTHTIVDVLKYSKEGNFYQLIGDLADENGWYYTRFPRG